MPRISEIRVAALRLVIDHGYDGFTMETLAQDVGISRRTLFNYVKDKESAVLGPEVSEKFDQQLQNFAAGLPTGSLREDSAIMANAEFDHAVGNDHFPEISQLTAQALSQDGKLLSMYWRRNERVMMHIRRALQAREGWKASDPRLIPTVSIIHTQFQTAIQTFVETHGRTSLSVAYADAGKIFEAYFDDDLA